MTSGRGHDRQKAPAESPTEGAWRSASRECRSGAVFGRDQCTDAATPGTPERIGIGPEAVFGAGVDISQTSWMGVVGDPKKSAPA